MPLKVLGKLQIEYGPRSLQVLAAAIDQGSQQHVRLFVKNFAPHFPWGTNTGPEAYTLFIPPVSCP